MNKIGFPTAVEKKTIIMVIAGLGIVLSLASYFFYKNETDTIKKQKYAELEAIATLKISQIIEWRNERLSDIDFFSRNTIFIQKTEALLSGNDKHNLQEYFASTLAPLQRSHGYANIYLVSLKKEVLFSLDNNFTETEPAAHQNIDSAVITQRITFAEFRLSQDKSICLDIAAPILNRQKIPVAVVVFSIDPKIYLYPLVQKWPIPTKSSETLIIQKSGASALFLNELRFRKNTALNLRIALTETIVPAVQAVIGYRGVFDGRDYRDTKVLSFISPIPGTNWFMIAKIDKSEIFADLYFRETTIIAMTFLLILIAGVGLTWFMHFRQRNIYLQLYKKEKELAASQEEFKTTLYSIGDGVITTDTDGAIKQMNHVAENLTGWQESNAIGNPIVSVFKIIDEESGTLIENPVKLVLNKGIGISLTKKALLITKDGKEIPIADSGAPIKNENNEIIGVVLVFREQIEERTASKLLKTRLTLVEYAFTYSLEVFLQKALDEVTALVESPIGFYHFVESDQKTLSLQAWSTKTVNEYCKAEGKELHYSVDKAGVWADCVYSQKAVIHNDCTSLPNKKGLPEGHAPLMRQLVVPIIRNEKVVAILGVGNKPTDYSEKDVEIVSFLADVAWELTVRKQAETALMKSENIYRLLANTMEDVIWLMDIKENRFLYISPSVYHLLGFTPEEVLAAPVDQILTPASREAVAKWMSEDTKLTKDEIEREKYRPRILEQPRKDGSTVWAEVVTNYIYDEHGIPVQIVGLSRDITERRKIEAELLAGEEKYHKLVEDINDGLYISNTNGELTFVNEALANILGYEDPNEILGKSFIEFVPQSKINQLMEFYKTAMSTGKNHDLISTEIIKKDGTTAHIEIKPQVIVDKGKIIGNQGMIRDVTERKRTEMLFQKYAQQLKTANEAKDKFFSIIAHDLRSPFHGFLGLSRILVDDIANLNKDEIKEYAVQLNGALNKQYELLSDLLNWSRLQRDSFQLTKEDVLFHDELEKVIDSLALTATQKGIELLNTVEDDLKVFCDIDMLKLVLRNLISNSIKFTNRDGRIVVSTHKKLNLIEVTVADNGVGISEGDISKLFQTDIRFTSKGTEEEKGTGLGLLLCKEIIEKHEGNIWVESEIGKGSKFTFSLPKNEH